MQAFNFYKQAIVDLLSAGHMTEKSSVLVVAGGSFDRSVLLSVGLTEVTVSNLDSRMTSDAFDPYRWASEDAERLSYADGSFDVVMVHAGLHHCRVPHQALAEMYRVARHGVLVIESRDNLLMRAAVRLGFTGNFEVEAVAGNDFVAGGQRNSELPNFVYRWTEREVEKLISSIDPTGPLTFRYFYGMRLPTSRLEMRSGWKLKVLRGLTLVIAGMSRLAPKQGNLFGVYVGKPRERWPWLEPAGKPRLSRRWASVNLKNIEGRQQH